MRNQKFIKTRERVVRYSMSDFIKAVHARPQLWERHHTDYHNRDKREQAWHEIATCLYSKFDAMATADKHKTVVMLTKRWKNTRDSFFRSQRRNRLLNASDEPPKTYIYEKELSFLLNEDHLEYENEAVTDDNQEADSAAAAAGSHPSTTSAAANTSSNLIAAAAVASKKKLHEDPIKIETIADDDDDDNAITLVDGNATSLPVKSSSRKKRRIIEKPTMRAKRNHITIACDLSEPDDIVEITKAMPKESNRENREHNENNYPALAPEKCAVIEIARERSTTTTPNKSQRFVEASNSVESDPDQSFFDSIKPVIRNMSMDQKLDFQIEVLKLLKDFRGKQ